MTLYLAYAELFSPLLVLYATMALVGGVVWVLGAVKRLLCRHRDLAFVRIVYGDEINLLNGKRCLWQCNQCGMLIPGTITRLGFYEALGNDSRPSQDQD